MHTHWYIQSTFDWHEEKQVKQFYPFGFFGVDKIGRPVFVDRLGSLNVEKLFKVTTEERLWKAIF